VVTVSSLHDLWRLWCLAHLRHRWSELRTGEDHPKTQGLLSFEETLLGLVRAVYKHTYFRGVVHQGGRRVVGDWHPTKLVFQEIRVKPHDFFQPYLWSAQMPPLPCSIGQPRPWGWASKVQSSRFHHRGKNWRGLVVHIIFQKAIGNSVYMCHKYIVISLVNISLAHRLFQSVVFNLQILRLSGYCFFPAAVGWELKCSCLTGRYSTTWATLAAFFGFGVRVMLSLRNKLRSTDYASVL
jgi:hypothetical protein